MRLAGLTKDQLDADQLELYQEIVSGPRSSGLQHFPLVDPKGALTGPFGIMQPKRSAPVVEPDLILVPLIAIDGQGTRLGRGKGHYDRALGRLRKTRARLIGLGWAWRESKLRRNGIVQKLRAMRQASGAGRSDFPIR